MRIQQNGTELSTPRSVDDQSPDLQENSLLFDASPAIDTDRPTR
jgi:hypothetical protein